MRKHDQSLLALDHTGLRPVPTSEWSIQYPATTTRRTSLEVPRAPSTPRRSRARRSQVGHYTPRTSQGQPRHTHRGSWPNPGRDPMIQATKQQITERPHFVLALPAAARKGSLTCPASSCWRQASTAASSSCSSRRRPPLSIVFSVAGRPRSMTGANTCCATPGRRSGDGAGVVEADLALSSAGVPGPDVDRTVVAGRSAAGVDASGQGVGDPPGRRRRRPWLVWPARWGWAGGR
jgi:hypothetical protein